MNKKYQSRFMQAKIERVASNQIAIILPEDIDIGSTDKVFFTVTGNVLQISGKKPDIEIPVLSLSSSFLPQDELD